MFRAAGAGIDPDSKVHGANMGPTWVLSAPDRPHVDPRTLLSGEDRDADVESDDYNDEWRPRVDMIIVMLTWW